MQLVMWTKPSGLLCHWQCFYIVVTRHAWWKVNMTSNIYCTSTNSLTIWTFCFQTFLWPLQRWGSREALPALKPSRRERCLHTTGNLCITIKTFSSIVSWWHITYFQGSCTRQSIQSNSIQLLTLPAGQLSPPQKDDRQGEIPVQSCE